MSANHIHPLSLGRQLLRPLRGLGDAWLHIDFAAARAAGLPDLLEQPGAIRILAEDALRRLPGDAAAADVRALVDRTAGHAIGFAPGRALLQDFLGVALLADLASLRDAVAERGGDPARLDPVIPVDFVVDHSLAVMVAGQTDALQRNRELEYARNGERFAFIKWCQQRFGGVRVIPPGRGIMHQVNLEWLSHVALAGPVSDTDTRQLLRADTLIGTDSHTTMVNALGVLGWGVGGIEAEMAMLGVPLEMTPPEVIGIRLDGRLPASAIGTDLVLHLTEFLRGIGCVGALLEFHGPGVHALSLPDRATVANMAPEFGATCALFPVDPRTLEYLAMTGRTPEQLRRIEAYTRAQGLWQDPDAGHHGEALHYDRVHRFDLGRVRPCMAGPTRPEQRVALADVPASFETRLQDLGIDREAVVEDRLDHGSVVIAAITSCTNTANPDSMITAGLLARNASRLGLTPKPWVKTSLSPGSRAVTDYLDAADLSRHLDALGFQTVGYGCATCNGNSGPLPEAVASEIEQRGLGTVAVLSGNRNFEGRIHPQIKAAYLASPPLVVAAALAGRIDLDLEHEPLGHDTSGQPVTLADLWPDRDEVLALVQTHVTGERYTASYEDGMESSPEWEALPVSAAHRFPWDPASGYIRPAPFAALGPVADFGQPLRATRALVVLGDGITTDHISPNGAIRDHSPAGRWLLERGETAGQLGNFGLRRGNAEVCARGMFDNPLLVNELLPIPDSGNRLRGNRAIHAPSGVTASIFEVAERYQADGTPTLIVAGRNYGAGSSRDWAAKGLRMLGVVAVLAESYERIHRSNLVGVGVPPLVFADGWDRQRLALTGQEELDLEWPQDGLAPGARILLRVRRAHGGSLNVPLELQVQTLTEVGLLLSGGVLPKMAAEPA